MLEKERQLENNKNAICLKKIQNALQAINETDKYLKNKWVKEKFLQGLAIGVGGVLGSVIFPFVSLGDLVGFIGVVSIGFILRFQSMQSASGLTAIRQRVLKRKMNNEDELSFCLEIVSQYKKLIDEISINVKELTELNQNDINQMFHKEDRNIEEINVLIKSLKKQLLHVEYLLNEEENIRDKDNFINMIVFLDKYFLQETKQLVNKLQNN